MLVFQQTVKRYRKSAIKWRPSGAAMARLGFLRPRLNAYRDTTHRSSPRGQPRGEARGQAGGKDAILRRFQVVRRAIELDHLRLGVEQRERRSPIAIPRLPHRTWIDQISHIFF